MKFIKILQTVASSAIDIVYATKGPISVIIEGGSAETRTDVASILADFVVRTSSGRTTSGVVGVTDVPDGTEVIIFPNAPEAAPTGPTVKIRISNLPGWLLVILQKVLPTITLLNPKL